jgi:hypothetical protein
MELKDLIANTLSGQPGLDPRLDAFTSGAVLVVATYEGDLDGDTYDDYSAYPFHDAASRIEAYIEAKRWYEAATNAEHVHTVSLAITLESTDY